MDGLAAGAGELGTNDALHPEPARDIFQLFGNILPEPLKLATAAPAGFAEGDHLLLTHKVIGQRLALGLLLRLLLKRPLDFVLGRRRDLFAFQQQFQLVEYFGPGAKAMPAHPGQLVVPSENPIRRRNSRVWPNRGKVGACVMPYDFCP